MSSVYCNGHMIFDDGLSVFIFYSVVKVWYNIYRNYKAWLYGKFKKLEF